MERYNIFNLIHKGLRASLYQTGLHLQQTDFTDAGEVETAIEKVREIALLFHGHAHKEDHFILPAVSEYEPAVCAAFESEHEADARLADQLNACIGRLEEAATDTDKIAAGCRLSEAFVAFTIFNLQHMAKEEDILNRLLWRYYTDDEIRAISGRLSASVEPWMQEYYAKWMLRGINNTEAATWMKAIERGMPPIVYQTLLTKAEEELPAQRFRAVCRSLQQSALTN